MSKYKGNSKPCVHLERPRLSYQKAPGASVQSWRAFPISRPQHNTVLPITIRHKICYHAIIIF